MQVRYNTRARSYNLTPTIAENSPQLHPWVEIMLEDGDMLRTKLLVSNDGFLIPSFYLFYVFYIPRNQMLSFSSVPVCCTLKKIILLLSRIQLSWFRVVPKSFVI